MDVIAEQGKLIYANVGDSMFPIIRERDLLIIEAVKEPLKVGDVPLYKRDSGQYVLHRIVEIKGGSSSKAQSSSTKSDSSSDYDDYELPVISLN